MTAVKNGDPIPLYEKVESIFDLKVSSSGAQIGILFEGLTEVNRMWINADAWILQRRKIEKLVREAEQKPIGDSIEIQVDPAVMKFVMDHIRMKPETVARRALAPESAGLIWSQGIGGPEFYELPMWKLKIIASLTRRFNWSIFLLESNNLKNISRRRRRYE